MHILVIPSWYSTPANPVRGSFFREQALALRRGGHQVGILVPPGRIRTWHGLAETRANWRAASHVPVVSDDSGLPTYRIPWWGPRGLMLLDARGTLALAAFDRYAEAHGLPDVIHAHSALYGGFVGAWIGAARHIPVVLTEHATFILRGPILPGQGRAIRYALRGSTRRLAVGPSLVAALRRFAPDVSYDVIGNSIDVDFFALPSTPLPTTPFRLTVIAHLYGKKRIDLLLHAFASVFSGQPVELHIGGDGPERARLERLANTLGISRQTRFWGRLSREDVRELIGQSHAVVSSSDIETFGVSLAEAMACGRPVVATRSGGPEFFVNDTNGLLVPRGDAGALAVAMRAVRDDYTRYEPEAIRRECVARFSEAAIVSRLEGIYAEVVAESSGTARDG